MFLHASYEELNSTHCSLLSPHLITLNVLDEATVYMFRAIVALITAIFLLKVQNWTEDNFPWPDSVARGGF